MSNENIKKAIADAIAHLNQRIARLDQLRANVAAIKPIEPINLIRPGEFPIAEIGNELKPWLEEEGLGGSTHPPALYVIGAENQDQGVAKLRNSFDVAYARFAESAESTGYKLTPRNIAMDGANDATDGTIVLYVGKSMGGIQERLKDHLWEASPSTGCLHLGSWAPDDIEGTRIVVNVQTFSSEPSSQDVNDALKVLEEVLWCPLQPMFGKPGGVR